jgi:phosphate starvation-inducible PhoH-like protein
LSDRREGSGGHRIEFDDADAFRLLTGHRDEHLKGVEKQTGTIVSARGTTVTIKGEPEAVRLASRALNQLYGLAKQGYPLYLDDVLKAVEHLASDRGASLGEVFLDQVTIPTTNHRIAPKGPTQKAYIDAIREHDIVFGIGPAGTGKTYLAMAMAVRAFMNKEVKRIVLARPAVEAGEKLGYLPGDLAQKVDPYLRPLYDALHDMMNLEKAQKLIERGTIEIAPLAFMRGRTLNDSFVILDEAQNSTPEQMKMFLTRLGYNSCAVITGDITQVDLPLQQRSGLVHASNILRNIEGIQFVEFTKLDVVRHPLVQRVIAAYEVDDERQQSPEAERARRDLVARAAAALETRRER